MKTIPPPCPEPESGPQYWRSLEQLSDSPQFRQWVEREFPHGAGEMSDPHSRRHFMRIMAASFLLAGAGGMGSGCRRPEEKILPFGKAPENYIHGVPQYFATSRPSRGTAFPLVARSNDGRPTKVEGNAQFPGQAGGTDVYTQASILDLYDPDRSLKVTQAGNTRKREAGIDFLAELARKGQSSLGAGIAFLSDRSSSPSRHRLQSEILAKWPAARWFEHEAVDFEVHREAARAAFGPDPSGATGMRPVVSPVYRLEKASRIVTLDADILGSEEESARLIQGYAHGRRLEKPTDPLSRLYAVESLMTLTGGNADHRLRVVPSLVPAIAARLAQEVLRVTGALGEAVSPLSGVAGPASAHEKWIVECAKDLAAHKGSSLVVAGYRQPLAVHLMAHAINAALGAVGTTLELRPLMAPASGSLPELAALLNRGQVDTLVILNDNPVYSAPADLDWASTQRKAKTVVRLGFYQDETGLAADWHFPATHYLESWSDGRTADGTLVPVQPLIAPLFDGVMELEFLARLAGLPVTSAYEIVRTTFKAQSLAGDPEQAWKKFLHDGYLEGSAPKPVAASFKVSALVSSLASLTPPAPASAEKLEVVFFRDSRVDDGRQNNNGWLQELPDPVTKMVWENVVLLSQKTADDLKLQIVDREDNNLRVPWVRVILAGRNVEGPAWIQPGMADHTVGLALGYGRGKAGRVGQNTGYNAYKIRPAGSLHRAAGAQVQFLENLHPLSTTQNHWAMEGRPIVREANLEQFKERPDFAKGMNMHEPPGLRGKDGQLEPLYQNPLDIPGPDGKSPRDRATHAWGMSIDLNTCVGCSACMIACQGENNIPIVGKNQVSRNREMHWIRLDRYYAGEVADPQMILQPMLCQHCESAPCENVCPVNATVHDEEGLNVMAYNRCVGTRYCSNNCPYKVRRFNYVDYNRRPLHLLAGPFYTTPLLHSTDGEWDLIRWWKNPDRGIRPDDEWELLKLVKNPDVTVRMRGVMEKCTFCVQRIEQAKIAQKVKAGPQGNIEVPDGTIKTACEQACPSGAIVFGNMKDPNSRVSKLKAQQRDYTVLEFLATKPRITYLAKIRNPNPAMPDYAKSPGSFKEWEGMGNKLGHHGAAHGTPGGYAADKKGAH
ncbi:MAG: 4Fe-4S dicluster domain-containing protein [Verrucomicrobia bacterium]|nr:4Fe-4S dicluster domain-containing protein [Verrucomicrobiota bacterium]